jgi:hypothetical protein
MTAYMLERVVGLEPNLSCLEGKGNNLYTTPAH